MVLIRIEGNEKALTPVILQLVGAGCSVAQCGVDRCKMKKSPRRGVEVGAVPLTGV